MSRYRYPFHVVAIAVLTASVIATHPTAQGFSSGFGHSNRGR